MLHSFDVYAEGEATASIQIECLIVNDVVATLELLGQLEVEELQQLVCCSKLIMPEQSRTKFCVAKYISLWSGCRIVIQIWNQIRIPEI